MLKHPWPTTVTKFAKRSPMPPPGRLFSTLFSISLPAWDLEKRHSD